MNIDLFGHTYTEKQKNFSRNNTGKRLKGDFYQTPKSMTEQFLDLFPVKHFPVLEPACGNFAISDILRKKYGDENVIFYDIVEGKDFLNEKNKYPTILTNPPFSISTAFIKKALECAVERISFLMPIDYLYGIERYENIFSVRNELNLQYVDVYVRRAMLTGEHRDDGKYNTGMITWAWYSWMKGYDGDPNIRWIDNDRFILRKKTI